MYIFSGVSAIDERDEIRAFRPLAQWREMIQSVGLTDSYLYEMEKGDPTYDEMMCFYKGELRTRPSTPDAQPEHDRPPVNRTNTMAFYENSERKVEALVKNLPNIAHETAKVVFKKSQSKGGQNYQNYKPSLWLIFSCFT